MKLQFDILKITTVSAFLFCAPMLQAQSYINSWTQSSPSVIFGLDTNGTLLSTGIFTNSASFNSDEAAATVLGASHIASSELLWVPSLGAMRVGSFSAPSTSTMGSGSFAFGQIDLASGPNSFATGYSSTALGQGAIAMGLFAVASGNCSFAEGNFVTATNSSSFAAGGSSFASGVGSVALGYLVNANGTYSAAFNATTTAASFDSTAFGFFNVGLNETGGTPSATTWVSSDPLFEIGNSSTPPTKTDALVIFKDGSSRFQGPITASSGLLTTAASVATTDIPMYSGN